MEGGIKKSKQCPKGEKRVRKNKDGSPKKSLVCKKTCTEGKVRDKETGRCRMKKTGGRKRTSPRKSPRRRRSLERSPKRPFVPYGGLEELRGFPPRNGLDLLRVPRVNPPPVVPPVVDPVPAIIAEAGNVAREIIGDLAPPPVRERGGTAERLHYDLERHHYGEGGGGFFDRGGDDNE